MFVRGETMGGTIEKPPAPAPAAAAASDSASSETKKSKKAKKADAAKPASKAAEASPSTEAFNWKKAIKAELRAVTPALDRRVTSCTEQRLSEM